MTTAHTNTLRLSKPDFRDPGWGNDINDNMDILDTITQALAASQNFEPWINGPGVITDVGEIRFDIAATPISYWICNVTHTNATGPTTFAQERAAHPTYWSAFIFSYRPRGAWTHDTQYLINDIAYDTALGITGICKVGHVSNHSGTINDDVADWDFIVVLPSSLPASAITYANGTSGLPGTNVQAALDQIDAINDTQTTNIATNTSGLATANTNIGTNTTNISTLQSQMATTQFEIGDVIFSLRPNNKAGWYLYNDGSIGNAGSAATIDANSRTQTLFNLLYGTYTDTQAPVSGGRGASAAADFAALKTISLLKVVGRALIAQGTGAGLTNRNPGTTVGTETHPLAAGEHAAHTHANALVESPHNHATDAEKRNGAVSDITPGSVLGTGTAAVNTAASTGMTITNASQGSGTGHNNMQPSQALYVHIRGW